MSSALLNGFTVGAWHAEPLRGQIKRDDGEQRHLEPKVMDVLVSLARHAGEPVTRDMLLTEVWGSQAVSDEPLTRAIGELRRALDDNRAAPTYVETIPKRGYRLIAEVQVLSPVESGRNAPHETEPQASFPGTALARRAGIAAVLIIVAAFAFRVLNPEIVNTVQIEPASPLSIAVLPFRNRSAIAEDAYFVDGIHDDIVTQLAKLSFVDKVISRTSMERYRQTEKSVPEIGAELGVENILEGGVQRYGDQIRINVQLIRAPTDEHLWAETYERELTAENIFAIQNEIASAVAGALQATLTADDAARLHESRTSSLAAYDTYLLGRQAMAKRTVADLQESRRFFQQASAADPEFALAHAALADSTALLVLYGGLPESAYAEAESHAQRALTLDGDLGEAHTSLGFIRWRQNRFRPADLDVAEASFQAAQQFAPNYAPAYQWHAMMLLDAGRKAEAADMMRRAIALDPWDPMLHTDLGSIYAQIGVNEAALTSFHRALDIAPGYAPAMTELGAYYLWHGEGAASLGWYRQALAIDPSNIGANARKISAHLALGQVDLADAQFARLEAMPETFWQRVYSIILADERGDAATVLRVAGDWLAENPQCVFCLEMSGWYLTDAGRAAEAVALFRRHAPMLFADVPSEIRQSNLYYIAPLAYALLADGQPEAAAKLIDAALDAAPNIPRILMGHRGLGAEDVRWHLLMGDEDAAIAALTDAFDSGWRLRHPRSEKRLFDRLTHRAEFQALVDALHAHMRNQRLKDEKSNPPAKENAAR